MSRFEIVRTDADQPWHARSRSDNGRIVWRTENYTRRGAAVDAIASLASMMSPTARIWVGNTQRNGHMAGSDIHFGHPGDTYADAHVIEIRDVDERTPAREPWPIEPPFYFRDMLNLAEEDFWHDSDYHHRHCFRDDGCVEKVPPVGTAVCGRIDTVEYTGAES